MKLLILLVTSALLGCSLAFPLERQELLDEVLEALAQESDGRDLADIESYQLADTEEESMADIEEDYQLAEVEGANELADMEDEDGELEDAEEQDLDSVLEALAQTSDVELADAESDGDTELEAREQDIKSLIPVKFEPHGEELADIESEEELIALVQEYLDQLEAEEQSEMIQSYRESKANKEGFFGSVKRFAKKTYNKAKKGIRKGINYVGKGFKKAKDIAIKIWKYRGLVKCIPRSYSKSQVTEITQKAVQCVMSELKKHPREVTIQFLNELADQVDEQGSRVSSTELRDAMIAAVASSIETAEQLEQVAMESENEEAIAEALPTKKAKKIVKKLKKLKKYIPCVTAATSGDTSKAIQCVLKKMSKKGKTPSTQPSTKPSKATVLEAIMNLLD